MSTYVSSRRARALLPLSLLLIVAIIFLGAAVFRSVPMVALQFAAMLPTGQLAGAFPLFVKIDYRPSLGTASVRGTALPGTVVQVKNDSEVVNRQGRYAMTTSLPISLVAVKDGKIRRFRFDLPPKASSYLSTLTVNADLTKMQSSVTGQLTITRHPPATITVIHVEKDSTHHAAIMAGKFAITLPLVRGTNTLRWWVQVGIAKSQGPDITFIAQ